MFYARCSFVTDFSGFVDQDKIKNYLDNRETFVSKARGVGFMKAVKDMDEYSSNPKV